MAKDDWGRPNTNAQDIRSMTCQQIAELLCDIKSNPDKYPVDIR